MTKHHWPQSHDSVIMRKECIRGLVCTIYLRFSGSVCVLHWLGISRVNGAACCLQDKPNPLTSATGSQEWPASRHQREKEQSSPLPCMEASSAAPDPEQLSSSRTLPWLSSTIFNGTNYWLYYMPVNLDSKTHDRLKLKASQQALPYRYTAAALMWLTLTSGL